LNNHLITQVAGKIDVRVCLLGRGQADRERLVGFQRRQKLYNVNRSQLRATAPLSQSRRNLIENHHPWYDWSTGKMARQARMIGRNRAAEFEAGHRTW
jgi:hypothetical protein